MAYMKALQKLEQMENVYDEFIEEYQYRKMHCGMRGDSGIVNISEKSRGTR